MVEAEAGLDVRRKRLIFRAWHRGTRETDLILGRFADAHVAGFSDRELADFERLLDVPDPDIFVWVTGAGEVPTEDVSPVLDTPYRLPPPGALTTMSETLSRPYAKPSFKAALSGGRIGDPRRRAGRDGRQGAGGNRRVAGRRIVFIARDGQRLAEVERVIRFFAPAIEILDFPAWDCLPYDRASPHSAVVARRMAALAALTAPTKKPSILLTTVNAALQKVPPRDFVARGSMSLAVGNQMRMDAIVRWLEDNGFLRSPTVREPGEYAVRGGIVDLFAAGAGEPVRLDFFGDTLESIRTFDTETQRTVAARKRIDLVPANEMQLSSESIARFRENYVARFGAPSREDLLYQSASEGRRYVGMEHWLPLFASSMETLFDHVGDAAIVLDHLDDEATGERLAQIEDHYRARLEAMEADAGGVPYNALPPDCLYLTREAWTQAIASHSSVRLSPFAQPASAT